MVRRGLDHWLNIFLDDYQWFRRWRGGHWERWFIGDYHTLWFELQQCSQDTGWRPGWSHGTPHCEDYNASC